MMLAQQKKSIPEIEVHERPGFGKAGHSFEVHSNFYGVKIRKKKQIYSLKIKSLCQILGEKSRWVRRYVSVPI